MSEELFPHIYNFVYIPFALALILVSSFFWTLHRKTRKDMADINALIAGNVTSIQVDKMINDKLQTIKESQSETIRTLKEMNKSMGETNIIMARMDERILAIDTTLVHRKPERLI